MSREIWLRLQLVVAIGEAVCRICTDKHKKQLGIGMEIEDEIRDKIRLIIPSSIEKNDTETDMIEPASHTLDHLSVHISEDNSSVEEFAIETDEIVAETEPILIAPASQDTNSENLDDGRQFSQGTTESDWSQARKQCLKWTVAQSPNAINILFGRPKAAPN